MNRRGFLGSILALGVAPWVITKAGVLMPVRQIEIAGKGQLLLTPEMISREALKVLNDNLRKAYVFGIEAFENNIMLEKITGTATPPAPALAAAGFLRTEHRPLLRPKQVIAASDRQWEAVAEAVRLAVRIPREQAQALPSEATSSLPGRKRRGLIP